MGKKYSESCKPSHQGLFTETKLEGRFEGLHSVWILRVVVRESQEHKPCLGVTAGTCSEGLSRPPALHLRTGTVPPFLSWASSCISPAFISPH